MVCRRSALLPTDFVVLGSSGSIAARSCGGGGFLLISELCFILACVWSAVFVIGSGFWVKLEQRAGATCRNRHVESHAISHISCAHSLGLDHSATVKLTERVILVVREGFRVDADFQLASAISHRRAVVGSARPSLNGCSLCILTGLSV